MRENGNLRKARTTSGLVAPVHLQVVDRLLLGHQAIVEHDCPSHSRHASKRHAINSVIKVALPECGLSRATSGVHSEPFFAAHSRRQGPISSLRRRQCGSVLSCSYVLIFCTSSMRILRGTQRDLCAEAAFCIAFARALHVALSTSSNSMSSVPSFALRATALSRCLKFLMRPVPTTLVG